ncbi:hypothetical protein BGZ92_001452 [Podila epicladia]|nr:hypothetical protein BGZ92_001452 [Podila epicladia]
MGNHNHSRDYHSNYYYGYNYSNDSYYNPNYDASMMPRDTPVLFTFPYPPYGHQFPTSVQVTGNFDEWQRTCYLHKNDLLNRFEAEVQIDLERLALVKDDEKMKRKVVFKYVLDGHNWITDPDQDQERDYEGNLNNIRFLQDITAEEKEPQEKNEEIKEHLNETIEDSGDAKPLEDGSAVPSSNNLHNVINGDEHDGDGDYGVVLLQGEPVTVSPRNKNGDAYPSIDESTMPTSNSSYSLETAITAATTTTAMAPSLTSSLPTSIHVSTAPSSVTSSATPSPTTNDHNNKVTTPSPTTNDHNNKVTTPSSHHGLFSNRKSMTVTPSAPTTAISTSAPAFPSTNTLSNVSSKAEKRKTGFWKKLKKALS